MPLNSSTIIDRDGKIYQAYYNLIDVMIATSSNKKEYIQSFLKKESKSSQIVLADVLENKYPQFIYLVLS